VLVAQELMALLDSAEREVLIISAYLIPTPALEDAVRRAEARGVEVRLLTNSIRSNNHLSAHSAYRNHIASLMSGGAALFEVRVDAEDRPYYIRSPVAEKRLALHAKALIVDDDKVFIGSANLDPRSLRINTEMGLLVSSRPLNAALREAVERDFADGNAWSLRFDSEGRVNWVSGEDVLAAQPADSTLQRIEDWFFAQLPIEDEL
jgi:putative cardiolipin synthase